MHLPHSDRQKAMPFMKQSLADLNILLQNIAAENRLGNDEITFIQEIVDEQSALINVLKEENFKMKQSTPQIQPLHDKLLQYKQEAEETILTLSRKLNETQLKVVDLEKKLTQIGVDAVVEESNKAKEVDCLNHKWQEKLKATESQSKQMIDEIVKKHCETKKGFETMIQALKEQLTHKEAEVAWCQLMIKERNLDIDKEIASLKRELEVTTLKNQELLQQRLAEVEKRANRMTKKCLKLQQNYEEKIQCLKKEKVLQVEALQKYVENQAERDSDERMEDAVEKLELRYQKIIVNLHMAAQHQRQQDLKRIAELENRMASRKVESDIET